MDFVFIAVAGLFFLACRGLVKACERM